MQKKFIRISDLILRTGKSRSAIWRAERSGDFPLRRQIGPNSVAWIESEVNEWIESRSKGVLQNSKFYPNISKKAGNP